MRMHRMPPGHARAREHSRIRVRIRNHLVRLLRRQLVVAQLRHHVPEFRNRNEPLPLTVKHLERPDVVLGRVTRLQLRARAPPPPPPSSENKKSACASAAAAAAAAVQQAAAPTFSDMYAKNSLKSTPPLRAPPPQSVGFPSRGPWPYARKHARGTQHTHKQTHSHIHKHTNTRRPTSCPRLHQR